MNIIILSANLLFQHNQHNFQLPEKLSNGAYTVKLVDTTLNSEIVILTMESPLIVNNAQENYTSLKLPINFQTKYGMIDPYMGQIQLYSNELTSNYWNYPVWLFWSLGMYGTDQLVNIKKQEEYTLMVKVFISSTNTWIVDEIVLSGEELLGVDAQNPLTISDNLNLLKVNYSDEELVMGNWFLKRLIHILIHFSLKMKCL